MGPIANLTHESAADIEFVLMDIDDTITTEGKLPSVAYNALWECKNSHLKVIPITGRPAGWCDLIARQWPVDGVVGENGALAFWEEDGHAKRMYHEHAVRNDNEILKRIRFRVLKEIEGTRIAQDQFCRMFDLAIAFAEEEPKLPLSVAQAIQRLCESEGAIAKISSIHVNTWLGHYNKLGMALRFLTERFGYDDLTMRSKVMFFGDSPNDEPMFSHFPNSVAVASINNYLHLVEHYPRYVTSQAGGEGFAEGVVTLLERKRHGS